MGTVIGIVVLILLFLGVLSRVIQRTREIRSSFRDSFGGGEAQTRENAARIMTEAGKGQFIPKWAVEDAAKELVKYNIGEGQYENEMQLTAALKDRGLRVFDLSKDLAIPRGTSRDAALSIIKGYLGRLNARYYKKKMELSEKDREFIGECMNAYFFGVTESTCEEASNEVDYLVDQWKVDVEDGKIS